MIAQGMLRLMRPLQRGLIVSKIRLVYLCGVTEQHHSRGKWRLERGFSSMCGLQDAPGESRLCFARNDISKATRQRWCCQCLGVGQNYRRQVNLYRDLCECSTDQVTVHFINRDGERLTTKAKEGESLLEVVVNQNLAIDGFGACEGTLACSTCHLIFDKDSFEKLDAISDEELDMLDLAYGLTETSRLGCQVHVKKSMDGLTVRVPMDVSDIRRQPEAGKQSKQ